MNMEKYLYTYNSFFYPKSKYKNKINRYLITPLIFDTGFNILLAKITVIIWC